MAPASKRLTRGPRARIKKRATRDYLNVTVSPATIERLDILTRDTGISRGMIVDASVRMLSNERALGRFAWCEETGCTRVRPDGCGGEWYCEEHEP